MMFVNEIEIEIGGDLVGCGSVHGIWSHAIWVVVFWLALEGLAKLLAVVTGAIPPRTRGTLAIDVVLIVVMLIWGVAVLTKG